MRLQGLLNKHQIHAKNAALIAKLALETDLDVPMRPAAGATPAGDEERLRGIPAIGRGVGGAMRGTRPDQAAA